MGHVQADILRFSQSNTWLNGLDKEFRNLKESNRFKLRGKELIEDKFVVLKKILRKQVVEPSAAGRFFGEPYKISGSDHFSIAKPKDANADQHRSLNAFLEEFAGKSTARQCEPKLNGIEASVPDKNYGATSSGVCLRTPGDPLPPDHPTYIRRDADDRIDDESSDYGETFTVKAAEQMGKTSLLLRYLARCEILGKKTALIDFRPFLDQQLADLRVFLTRLAGALLDKLGCNPALARPIESCHDFTAFVGNVILRNIDEPIVLAFDNVDRLIDQDYRDSFFYSLREWSTERTRESSAREPEKRWRRLSLILTIATEPTLLVKTAYMSPFNVTDSMRLQAFTEDDISHMNRAYGSPPLDESGIKEVFDLLGGHPCLTQGAYYRLLGRKPMTIGTLTAKAIADDGPFTEHLRAKHRRLDKHAELANTFRNLLRFQTQPSQSDFYRLQALGLVKFDDSDRIVPANRLYARFFERVLQ